MIFRRFYTTTIINNNNKLKLPKVLVLSGSTGAGKSRVALELAKDVDGEIICADSVQIYKHLTIGSNSIDTIEQKDIKFHLFGYLDFDNKSFNVYEYYKHAKNAISDIVARGKTPIIVGGCGFYLDSILKGSRNSSLTPKEREEIDLLNYKIKSDWDYYYDILKELDLESAQSITKNNALRLAMSLYFNTIKGIKFSTLKNQYSESIKDLYDFRCFYLTTTRDQRNEDLSLRCDQMLSSGLIEEVFDLLINHDSFLHSRAAESLGYKETIKLFLNQYPTTLKIDGKEKPLIIDELNYDSITNYITDFKISTRRYSKRQDVWFKKQKEYHWLDSKNNNLKDILLNKFNSTKESFELNRNIEEEERLKSTYVGYNPPNPQVERNYQFISLFNNVVNYRNILINKKIINNNNNNNHNNDNNNNIKRQSKM